MRGIIRLFSGFIVFGTLLGCQGYPDKVLAPDDMEDFLYDYHLAQVMGSRCTGDQSYQKELYLKYVFEKHHVTEEQFDSSLVWYTNHSDEMTKIYLNLDRRFTKENKSAGLSSVDLEYLGDTADIWIDRRLYRLSNTDFTRTLNFEIPGDSNFHRKDLLEWNANFIFLPMGLNITQNAYMTLRIRYANDSVVSRSRAVDVSGSNQLRIYAAPNVDIKDISGYIYYNGKDAYNRGYLLVNNLVFHRIHSNDSIPNVSEPVCPAEAEQPLRNLKQDSVTPMIPEHRLSPQQMRNSKPIVHKQRIRKR